MREGGRFSPFGDGVATVYATATAPTPWGSPTNPRRLDDLTSLGTLCFRRVGMRAEDSEFAGLNNVRETLKIMIPHVPESDAPHAGHSFVIEGWRYECYRTDMDAHGRLYCFLNKDTRMKFE